MPNDPYDELATPVRLMGDGDRVRQIVVNLVANAVKFTPSGEVMVEARCLKDSEEHALVQIRVADTGIGIEPNRRAAIFESFTQADSSLTRRFGGSGLGLTITKRLVELMGGTIDLESTVGQGSTFWIELPFDKQFAEPEIADGIRDVQSSAKPEASLGLHVLLAEDNMVNAMLASERLEMWGCECFSVEDGFGALHALRERIFDAVLMDVSMPGMDGLEATRECREHEKLTGAHVPIIAMTAHALDEDRQRCLAAGMDDYLSKPIDFDDLFRKLSAIAQSAV